MLHRTQRSIALTLALAVFGILLTGHPGSSYAQTHANDLAISFEDIETYVGAASPRARIIAQELTAVKAERDQALQWSNPALAYDRENRNDAGEWQVTLQKRFAKPFAQGKAQDGWNGIVRAAELQGQQATADLLTELKAGYVRLRLYDHYLDRLAQLSELVTLAAQVAESRHAEGEMSGVNQQLVQLASFSVDATSRRVRQQHRQTAAEWRAEMGIFPGSALELVTSVVYQPVTLSEATTYTELLTERPGTQSLATMVQALGLQAAAAQPSLIPGFNLYGGYKRFEGIDSGYVAGVALDLPLFDRNAGAARKLEAERVIVQNELTIKLARSQEEITSLIDMIGAAQPPLAKFADQLESRQPLADTLLFSYREGSLSLDALLGAIQIETAALENYFDELVGYYRNIFRLEAITGISIVHFAPEEN